MSKRVLSLAVVSALLVGPSLGERLRLVAPARAQFSATDHMRPDYREAVQSFCDLVELFDSSRLQEACLILKSTLNQQELLSAIEPLEDRLDQLPLKGALPPDIEPDADQMREKLKLMFLAVKRQVESGRYVLSVPVEFSIDEEAQRYELRWRQWSGEDYWTGSWSGDWVIRLVKFMPKMEILVLARYDPAEGGSYGYDVRNGQDSRAPFRELWIECGGLTAERLQQLQVQPELLQRHNDRLVLVAAPFGGYIQDFHLSTYDLNEFFIIVGPGKDLSFPPLLRVPYPQLPGVVKCWVPVHDFPHPQGLDVEADPEDLTDIFTEYRIVETRETGPKKVPRFMYHGKTIGPVPAPEPGNREGFLQEIQGYWSEARYWGWCPDESLAEEIEGELTSLSGAAIDEERITILLGRVENAQQDGRLLEEAFVLLKYNLAYLADEKNWSKP